MSDKPSPVPPGGVQIGLRFRPESDELNQQADDEQDTHANPNTATAALRETLEAQDQHPLP